MSSLAPNISELAQMEQKYRNLAETTRQQLDYYHYQQEEEYRQATVREMHDQPERYVSITRRVRALGYAWKHATHEENSGKIVVPSASGTLRYIYHCQKHTAKYNAGVQLHQAFFYKKQLISGAMSDTDGYLKKIETFPFLMEQLLFKVINEVIIRIEV